MAQHGWSGLGLAPIGPEGSNCSIGPNCSPTGVCPQIVMGGVVQNGVCVPLGMEGGPCYHLGPSKALGIVRNGVCVDPLSITTSSAAPVTSTAITQTGGSNTMLFLIGGIVMLLLLMR